MMNIPKKIEDDDNPGLLFGPELDLWSVGKVRWEVICFA